MTRVSVVPRKVTVKIGDAENWWCGCRDKNRLKKTKIPVCLVLEYPLSLESEVRPIKYVLSLLVKHKLKNLLSLLRYRLPRFRGKGQNQPVATFWRHKSIKIDRLNYKLVSISGPFRSKNKIDNLTKIQSSNAWISSWNAQMLHFLLCRESVTGMPRIEIEFEFDMVFCFGVRLAP